MYLLKKKLDDADRNIDHVIRSIVIRVVDGGGGEKFFTIRKAQFDSAEELDEILKSLEAEDYEGSDKVDKTKGEDVDKSRFFVLFHLYDIRNEGKEDFIVEGKFDQMCLFKTHKIASNGYCGYECLKKINPKIELTKEEYDKQKMKQFKHLKEYLDSEDNLLKVNVLLATLKFKRSLFDDKSITEKIAVKNGRKETVYKLKECPENHIYIGYKYDNPDGTLLIDVKQKHCDLIEGIPRFDEIYFNSTFEFYKKIDSEFKKLEYGGINIMKDNREITTDDMGKEYAVNQPLGRPLIDPIKVEYRFLFYDYEAVTDWSCDNIFVPYGIGFLDLSIGELGDLLDIDKPSDDEEIEQVKEIKRKAFQDKVITIISYNCTNEFFKYICSQKDVYYTLVSFNGANFDHYILYRELLKSGCDILSKPFFNGTMMLNFNIAHHGVFDLARHITNISLKEACESYNIRHFAKKEFNHYDAQQLYDYDDEEFIGEYKNNKEINEYMKYDILSLATLFTKYKQSVEAIPNITVQLEDYSTIGSMMYDVLGKHIEGKITLPTFKNEEQQIKIFKDMRESLIGGRCQLFNGVQMIEDEMTSPDACSLYPYIMSVYPVHYASGEIVMCEKLENMPDDKIGFFYCDIEQKGLKKKKLPLIYPEKTKKGNDWDTDNKIKNVLISTVKIAMLKKYGAKVTVREGLYFTDKVKGCELFSFLLEIMKLKNEQDILKAQESKDYNPSYRNTLKLLSNVLSGKLNESLHVRQTTIIKNENEYKQLELKYKNICTENILNENTTIVTYDKFDHQCMKSTKPIYLGILIYDYSQQYMYENVYSKIPSIERIYTDTDSMKMIKKTFDNWVKDHASKTIVPHWKEVEEYDKRYENHKLYEEKSKVYGSFDDEYKGKYNNISFFLSKKAYFTGMTEEGKNEILKTDKDAEFEKKLSLKGIKLSDIWIKEDKVIEKIKKQMCTKEKIQYFHENEKLKIKNNLLEFFKYLYENKSANVLTNGFMKCKESITVSVYCTIKTITI